MFSYPDAARYRLGVNYQQLPTNAALSDVYSPMQRDGFANFRGNYGPDPNYVGSTLRTMTFKGGKTSHDEWVGRIADYSSEITDDDFAQATALWNVFGKHPGQQKAFASNVAENLKPALPAVKQETISECLYTICQDQANDAGRNVCESFCGLGYNDRGCY
jgi:catalase